MNENIPPSPESNVWPPPPSNQAGIWPPPPSHESLPVITMPFRTAYLVHTGSVSNFRVGNMTIGEQGVTIQGKAVLPYEQQVPVLVVCWLLSLFVRYLFIIAYFVMEYGIRRDEMIVVPWNQVRNIILVPKRRQACLVFDAPNYKGVIKTFSLAFRLKKEEYDYFAGTIGQAYPAITSEGRLKAKTSPRTWVFLIMFLVVIALAAGFAFLSVLLRGHP